MGRRAPLEKGVRLSASRLWEMQRAYFAAHDPLAWTLGPVPSYVTSNAYIARAKARVVHALVEDARSPVPIVELGAGSGRFAHGFVRELDERLGRDEPPRFTYVVTDFDAELVDVLRSHPRFAPFVARGLVDFAVVDARSPPQRIDLLEAGTPLDQRGGPLVVVANYVLDGIPSDAFEVADGSLHESLVRVALPAGARASDPQALGRADVAFERGPPADAPYGDAELDALVRDHARLATDGHFLFPVAGLRLLRALRRLAEDRLLVLASDRGHVHEEALAGLDAPKVERHGSFSLDVNFHAYAQHARATGGVALVPPHHPTHLATVGLAWGLDAPALRRVRRAYEDHLAEGGPEDLYLVKEVVERGAPPADLEHGLAWLRVAAWDHEVFLLSLPGMLRSLGTVGEDEEPSGEPAAPTARHDALDAARRVRDAYYAVEGDPDVEGALGELFEALDAMPEAVDAYEASIARSGATAPRLHRLAVGRAAIRRTKEALDACEEALALEPRYEPARALRVSLLGEHRRGKRA